MEIKESLITEHMRSIVQRPAEQKRNKESERMKRKNWNI